MTFHDIALPTPAPQVRADGWSPARQRLFVETLAATGVVRAACDAAQISERSAYALRIRADGAAFRIGWDAAILIARARLADTLLARALLGQEEVMTREPDGTEVRRHRHDNRLAMSMLARLDRMADAPAEGTDAALARIVAQDFAAFCDLLCPPHAHDAAPAPADAASAPLPEPGGDEARPALPAALLSPAASVALFLAARMPLTGAQKSALVMTEERCELRPQLVRLASLPPEEAAAKLRGIWWDDRANGWRTDFPPPPGFDGEESEDYYDIDRYRRALTDEEEDLFAEMQDAQSRPYEEAATRAREAFFAQGHALVQDAPTAA